MPSTKKQSSYHEARKQQIKDAVMDHATAQKNAQTQNTRALFSLAPIKVFAGVATCCVAVVCVNLFVGDYANDGANPESYVTTADSKQIDTRTSYTPFIVARSKSTGVVVDEQQASSQILSKRSTPLRVKYANKRLLKQPSSYTASGTKS